MLFPLAHRLVVLGIMILFSGGSGLAQGKTEVHTPLGEEMEAMAKGLRTLRRQIAQPAQQEASLKVLEGMEKNALKARELVPAKAKDVPEADRVKFVAAYQLSMDELVEALRKISVEVRAGKFEAAKESLGKLQALKRKGHQEFSAEQEDE